MCVEQGESVVVRRRLGDPALDSEDLIAAFQRWVADGLQNSSRGNASVQEREQIRLSAS